MDGYGSARRFSRTAVVLFAVAAGAACEKSPSASGTPDHLLEADRAFARATAERGLDGWMSCFAEDAVRIDPAGEAVRGLEAIRRADAALFEDPEAKLEWEPADAGLFADGRHGYTRGRYELVRREPGKPPETLARGSYLTVWRRDGGRWKVILDTGSADAPPSPPGAEE